jgi:hypothetical protein
MTRGPLRERDDTRPSRGIGFAVALALTAYAWALNWALG